jgi:hypothetical protein
MMIFMAFYAYDRSLLEHSAYHAALVGTLQRHDEATSVSTKAKNAAAVLVNGMAFAVKDMDYGVSVESDNVTVTYHCVVNMPFKPWLAQYISGFSDDYMTFDISKSAPRLDAPKFIRTCKTIKNIGDNLGGENE